jgi:hypothetical protein
LSQWHSNSFPGASDHAACQFARAALQSNLRLPFARALHTENWAQLESSESPWLAYFDEQRFCCTSVAHNATAVRLLLVGPKGFPVLQLHRTVEPGDPDPGELRQGVEMPWNMLKDFTISQSFTLLSIVWHYLALLRFLTSCHSLIKQSVIVFVTCLNLTHAMRKRLVAHCLAVEAR